jgi:cobalt/nickel transport system ATP-binding protein
LTGILPLTQGEIFIDGERLSKKTVKLIRRKIGFVFQNPDDQLFTARIYDDILFGPRSAGLSESEAGARAREILEKLGISHLAEKSPSRLSGGEKRLSAMAAVLVMEPELLLFDEPTAFLDPRARRSFSSLIQALPQTKIIATHDLAFAGAHTQRALVLHKGSLAADGNPAELFGDVQTMEEWGL